MEPSVDLMVTPVQCERAVKVITKIVIDVRFTSSSQGIIFFQIFLDFLAMGVWLYKYKHPLPFSFFEKPKKCYKTLEHTEQVIPLVQCMHYDVVAKNIDLFVITIFIFFVLI